MNPKWHENMPQIQENQMDLVLSAELYPNRYQIVWPYWHIYNAHELWLIILTELEKGLKNFKIIFLINTAF